LNYELISLIAVSVRGTVHVGGRVTVGVSTTAQLTLGDKFTLLNNDGVDPVTGPSVGSPEGAFVGGNQKLALQITYHGGDGNDIAVTVVRRPTSAVGAGQGGLPLVSVYDASGGLMRSFLAYQNNFTGGVRVVVADVTGDGVNDVVTAPGPGGGPVVRIWDGYSGAMVRQFNAYNPAFRGGVFLATADLNGDGVPEIVTGAGAGGGPHVRVFDGVTGAVVNEFLAYDPRFTGGVSVAAHERIEVFTTHGNFVVPGSIVTGAGPGGGPHVRVFDGLTAQPFSEFLAYDPLFTGGVNVATGTLGTAGPPFESAVYSIITAPASNGGPDVRLFEATGRMFDEFLAYDSSFFGGVTLATIRISANFAPILLTGAGPGGGPHVKQWQYHFESVPPVLVLERSLIAFDPAFTGGVFVG
jgi:hypothetical protein